MPKKYNNKNEFYLIMETYLDIIHDVERKRPVVLAETEEIAQAWIDKLPKKQYQFFSIHYYPLTVLTDTKGETNND